MLLYRHSLTAHTPIKIRITNIVHPPRLTTIGISVLTMLGNKINQQIMFLGLKVAKYDPNSSVM